MDSTIKKTYSAPLFFMIAAAALWLYSCSGPAEKTQEKPQPGPAAAKAVVAAGDPAAGKIIYEKHCHYCHGKTGLGDGPVGLALSPHPVDFVNDRKRMSKSDQELFKSISEGIKRDIGGESMSMPRWAEVLSEKERWDVLAYVRQFRKKEAK